jgi:hypothetical protein
MTRTIATLFAAAAAMLGTIGSAFAADMTETEIKAFVSNKTIYLQIAPATGTVSYFAPDGAALYKLPTGAILHGKWTTKGNQLCVDWKESPNSPCLKYVKEGDKVTVHDANTGKLQGTITKTAPGNAEKITP